MRLFRRHRSGLGWFATLALLVGTLAALAVPHPVQSGRQVYDQVLGWMPVCAPSQAGKTGGGTSQHAPGAGHACCAFACAAAASPAALAQLVLRLTEFPQTTKIAVSRTEAPRVRQQVSTGTLGSRGPPLHA